MKDNIIVGQDKETKLWHAEYYINHPTPSGGQRPRLMLSTKQGCETKKEAVDVMKSAFSEERLKEMEYPKFEEDLT